MTLCVLCVLSMIKGADLQLLPTSFRAMEVELHMVPAKLAVLAVCQGVSAALTGPIWGALVEAGADKSTLLTTGVGLWGVCTVFLGIVSSFQAMCVLRIFNGLALSVLLPVTQSFVVDISGPDERGKTFGWLVLASHIGSLLACLFVTPIAGIKFFNVTGWRVACISVGTLSLSAILLIRATIVDTKRKWDPTRLSIAKEFQKFSEFLKIPTFSVIILQGVFGTIPGAAMSFLTMYFQYVGITNTVVGFINTTHVIGSGMGGLLGGFVGDTLNGWSPRCGRAVTAQISLWCSLPIVCVLFRWIPREPVLAPVYAGIFFLYGLIGTWTAPGCLCPIMSQIVPKRSLASAYAWELAIVFCSGNLFGPVLVGYLSQTMYGYVQNHDTVHDMDPTVRDANARALGHALFIATSVPCLISSVILSLLFFTHHADTLVAPESDSEADVAASDAQSPTEKTSLVQA